MKFMDEYGEGGSGQNATKEEKVMKHDGLSKAFIVISLLFVLMIEPASELSAQASMNRNNTVDTLM